MALKLTAPAGTASPVRVPASGVYHVSRHNTIEAEAADYTFLFKAGFVPVDPILKSLFETFAKAA